MEEDFGPKMSISSMNYLLLYNKNYEKFITQFGAGMSLITRTMGEIHNPLSDPETSVESFLRMAIGKNLNYKKINFTPMLEMNYFNEEVGFSVMSRFNF